MGLREYVIQNLLRRFTERYPDMRINLMLDTSRHLMMQLENETLDMAVVTNMEDKPGYEYVLLENQTFSLAVPEDSELLAQAVPMEGYAHPVISIRGLKGQRFVMLSSVSRNGTFAAEILRKYMVHLIDEDVHSRRPLRRAMNEGGEREIEAARQPAIAICGEIINMMNQSLELARELTGFCPKAAMHYVGESAELALATVKAARMFIVDLSDYCSDDTYRFVIRRENEITLEQCEKNVAAVREAAEKAI